ncbi:DUF4214 domain-containing protein [Duganella aquatilis]|nr:DUF4214 domain-containing protein [Duganella aquatilis]
MTANLTCTMIVLAALAACGGTTQDAPQKKTMAMGSVARDTNASTSVVSVAGYRTDYAVRRSDDGVVTVTNKQTGAVATYAGTQLIKFFDTYVSFDVDGPSGQIYRLYQAAFNRQPDLPGLGFWIWHNQNGLGMLDISADFIGSDEFQKMYGPAVTNSAFVNLLYNNILHRDGEKAGVDWWVANLKNGSSQAGVLYGFSDSAENKNNLAASVANGFDYVPFDPSPSQSICKHTPADKPLVFAGYNVSTNEWNIVDGAGNLKPLPFAYTECATGKSLPDNAISASWNWSLPQADWQYPESATNTQGYVKAFPEIIYGRQLWGATSSGSTLPMLVSDVNLTANYDVNVDTDGLPLTFQQTFLQGTYISTKDSNDWLTSVTVMLMPTKVCMDECGNPHKFIETIVIDGITYYVYMQVEMDEQKGIPRYNVELLVKEDHLRGSMKMKSINDYLISKGWLKPNNYMNSIEMGTEIISGAGKTTVKHFSVTQ